MRLSPLYCHCTCQLLTGLAVSLVTRTLATKPDPQSLLMEYSQAARALWAPLPSSAIASRPASRVRTLYDRDGFWGVSAPDIWVFTVFSLFCVIGMKRRFRISGPARGALPEQYCGFAIINSHNDY